MVLRIVFRKVSSRLSGGLGHLADSNNIPQNQPTIFCRSLIVIILLMFLISICVPFFQQFEEVLDDSCGGDVEEELVPELDDNPRKRGTNISVLQKNPLQFLVNRGFLPAGPLVGIYVFLAELFQVIELQACRRLIAPSRRDQYREHTLVLPRLFASPPLAVTTVVESWISAEYPSRLSSNPSCSTCALMLWSQRRFLAPVVILKWAPALPWHQWESKT